MFSLVFRFEPHSKRQLAQRRRLGSGLNGLSGFVAAANLNVTSRKPTV
jgi:hypothetical protein